MPRIAKPFDRLRSRRSPESIETIVKHRSKHHQYIDQAGRKACELAAGNFTGPISARQITLYTPSSSPEDRPRADA